MTIKSGSGIIEIWRYPINDPEVPDLELNPQHQLDPIKINIEPIVHEVKTDDSEVPERRYNKGVNCTITITLSDIGLDIIRGFLPNQGFFGSESFEIGQEVGFNYQTHEIRVLPNPRQEDNQRWRDSVITLTECHLTTDSTSLDFGINTQKSWRAIAQATSKSKIKFGMDNE